MKSLNLFFIVLFISSAFCLHGQNGNHYDSYFTGKWTVSGVSAFAEPGSLPNYQHGDYIWDFGDGDGYQITVTLNNPKLKEDSYTLKQGKYPFWSRRCLVKIDNRIYHVQFDNPGNPSGISPPPNKDGSPAQLNMYLHSNLDPRLPDAGYTLILTKMK